MVTDFLAIMVRAARAGDLSDETPVPGSHEQSVTAGNLPVARRQVTISPAR
jgi:hypothetical protein